MKRVELFLCSVLLALALVLELCGCTDEKVLYENQSVIITRAGREITVDDLTADQTYTLQIRRSREHTEGKKLIESPTLTIETGEGRLVVTDRQNCVIITIRL